MTGSLNRAFMRAYAKDRAQAKLDAAAKAQTEAAAAPHPASPPIPQIFSGRYAAPAEPMAHAGPAASGPSSVRKNASASYRADRPQEASPTPVHQMPNQQPPAPNYPSPQQAEPSHAQARQIDYRTDVPPQAPSRFARQASPSPIPQQPSMRSVAAPQANMNPQSNQPPRVGRSLGNLAPNPPRSAPAHSESAYDSGADSVWQRIDQAHTAMAPNAAGGSPRTTASVGVAAGGGRCLQAAAQIQAPPVAGSNAPQLGSEIDLPLLTDPNENLDGQAQETRRRSVADFLYKAGQVSKPQPQPQILRANAASPRSDLVSGPNPTLSRVAPPMQSHAVASEPNRSYGPAVAMDHAPQTPAYAPSYDAPALPRGYESEDWSTTMPTESPAVESSPMPRRMGQILRVDAPRTGSSAVENMPPVARAMPAAPPVRVPAPAAPMPRPQAAPPQVPPQIDEPQPTVHQTHQALGQRIEVESRSLHRVQELSQVEEKLRTSQHKVFNPIWEVDRLQWPSVCDKLMEQRAQSMAQVAAHLKMACQDGLSVLGVTSANKSEGRTTVACCLARLAAMHGMSVALVDMDLDNPTLCLQTNMEVEQDWRDAMASGTSLEDVAVHSIEDQLTVLPLKERGGRPGLMASDERLAGMLASLSESFDLVLVDTCRLQSTGNAIAGLASTKIFDAAIIVVDRRNSNQERVELSVRELQQAGIESIGIVDNFSM